MRRSPREIAFRARQEAANLKLLLAPPRLPAGVSAAFPLPGLPEPRKVADALRGSRFEAEIGRLAEQTLAHRFSLLGYEIETGPEIEWRRDYVHQRTSGLDYFRRIPYLDFERVGDHKVTWELNRHQHLVTLAQAWLFFGRKDAIAEIEREVESWWVQNPAGRGINWASALEVAFRALSWIWVWHLAGPALEDGFARRLLESLYQHGCYLRENLSVYFSPNTHLLGEAVALHALGRLFSEFPESRKWRRIGRETTLAQMSAQIFADGAHFEKSSYYHVYSLDMFLLHATLEQPPAEYLERLKAIAGYAHALAGPGWEIPLLGDDDGGRLFHPFGERAQFCRGSLAVCAAWFGCTDWQRDAADAHEMAAWWLGPERCQQGEGQPFLESRLFAESGLAVMASPDAQLILDVRAFGAAGAGHSHAHALSVVCRRGAEWLLVDPGTFTYISDVGERAMFRGTAAHNTVCIDGADQAAAAGPFRWADKPAASIRSWSSSGSGDEIDAECRYRGFVHRRRIRFRKPGLFLVVDAVDGPEGEHTVEAHWTGANRDSLACISFAKGTALHERTAARSRAFGHKETAIAVVATKRGTFPMTLCAVIDTSGRKHDVEAVEEDGRVRVLVDGQEEGTP